MRIAILSVLILGLVVSGALIAQQPNTPTASLTIDDVNGPPWPIKTVRVQNAVPLVGVITGQAPFDPLALAISYDVEDVGTPMLGGNLMDLVDPGIFILLGPTLPGPHELDPTGKLSFTVYPNVFTPGTAFGAQAVVANAAALQGVTFTAATRLASGAIDVLTHTLTEDGWALVDLTPYGVALPFYGVSYTSYFVNANGFVSFGQSTADFTSTPQEFTSQMPRIAGMWTDLSPVTGGTVQSRILAAGAASEIWIDFVDVPPFGAPPGGPLHNMSIVMRGAPDGTIDIVHPATQQPAPFPMLTGITAGLVGVAGAQVDLSAIQDADGLAFPSGEPIFEWYGIAGQPNYTGPTNLFDLFERGIRFVPIPDIFTPTSTPGALGYWLQ